MRQAKCACQPDHDSVRTSVRGFGPHGARERDWNAQREQRWVTRLFNHRLQPRNRARIQVS